MPSQSDGAACQVAALAHALRRLMIARGASGKQTQAGAVSLPSISKLRRISIGFMAWRGSRLVARTPLSSCIEILGLTIAHPFFVQSLQLVFLDDVDFLQCEKE